MIPKWLKETGRYVIILAIMALVYDLSYKAFELESEGKLTMQFAGVVASAYGALTFVLKFIFETKVSHE